MTVFLLQEEAWYNNISITTKRIARAYSRVSAKSKEDAFSRGSEDQLFVQEQFFRDQVVSFIQYRRRLQRQRGYNTYQAATYEQLATDFHFQRM